MSAAERPGQARRVAELRFVAARSGYVRGWESAASGVVRNGSCMQYSTLYCEPYAEPAAWACGERFLFSHMARIIVSLLIITENMIKLLLGKKKK